MMMRYARLTWMLAIGLALSGWQTPLRAADDGSTADLVLRGAIESSDLQTYQLIPFDVPVGTRQLAVSFDYTGRAARTTIDLGLMGPGQTFGEAFRGWSGGNKRSFRLSAHDATPSYYQGPIVPGRWHLLLGIPNIHSGERSEFTASIYFNRHDAPGGALSQPPLNSAAGWYRGDLHLHSGHSDGTCDSRSGATRVPCPLFLTLEAAAARGLDFIAVTEHNTSSHVRELTALQPYFDRLLLIPGMEVTTFQGHANAFGVREPIDFRVGSGSVPDWNALLTFLNRSRTFVSINHPRTIGGEVCMGCAWAPDPPVDFTKIQAVEVVNGHDAETAKAGIPFWHEQLNRGFRLTGIGGSDTHDATAHQRASTAGEVGTPTTVVYANDLTEAAIIDGMRAGRVFVDVTGVAGRLLEFGFKTATGEEPAGSEVVTTGRDAQFVLRIKGVEGGSVEVIQDGTILAGVLPPAALTPDFAARFTLKLAGRHWVRVNVRDREGRLALVGNPIYVNWR